jgi:hypothetical protein
MRRLLILSSAVVAIVACTKTETPAADTSAAMAPAPAPVAPAPVAVTEAQVAGTWSGVSMPAGSDSVVNHWTQVCAAGKCKGSSAEDKGVTINSSYTMAGDSAVGTSEPFTNAKMVKNGKIIDNWVVQFMGDSATGTGHMNLASKPDSIVMAYHFAGAKKK